MDEVSSGLTVFFSAPFWIGIFEQVCNGELPTSKVTFGSEPKDYEVYEFIQRNYYKLRFSPAVAVDMDRAKKRNPKRVQREIHKQVNNIGIGTKSQQALKMQQEQMKTERKAIKREKREAEKKRQFDLKQQKKKKKHRGR